MQRVCVITPTYNEAENIRSLLDTVFKDGVSNDDSYSISAVIVDDYSPDKTAEVAQKHADTYGYDITIISGDKTGLGDAYKRGYKHVIDNDLAEIIIMIDADLSHDAKEIKNLVAQVNNGSDLVVGSRYVSEGKIPGDWPMLRIVNSRVARFVTRYVGGLSEEIEDPAGGFRAINVKTLKSIDFNENVGGTGYVFQVGTVEHFLKKGKKVSEVPISFNDRQFGKSKIRIMDVLEYFAFCLNMKPTSPFKTHLLYLLKGVLALVIFALVATISNNNGINPYIGRVLGLQAALGVVLATMPDIFAWFKNDSTSNESVDKSRIVKYTLLLDAFLVSVVLSVSVLMSRIGWNSVLGFSVTVAITTLITIAFAKFANTKFIERRRQSELTR